MVFLVSVELALLCFLLVGAAFLAATSCEYWSGRSRALRKMLVIYMRGLRPRLGDKWQLWKKVMDKWLGRREREIRNRWCPLSVRPISTGVEGGAGVCGWRATRTKVLEGRQDVKLMKSGREEHLISSEVKFTNKLLIKSPINVIKMEYSKTK